jgi:hypothetical protein
MPTSRAPALKGRKGADLAWFVHAGVTLENYNKKLVDNPLGVCYIITTMEERMMTEEKG